MPLVSIITPAYNATATIQETIDSVYAQDFKDWEWCLADDASQDATPEIIRKLAAKDSRIRLLALPGNVGSALARARAYNLATGRFIAFLDADDLWLPGKLKRQINFMNQKHAAFSYTAYRRVNAANRNAGVVVHVPEKITYRQLLGNTAIACSTAMVDRELTGELPFLPQPVNEMTTWLALLRRGIIAQGLDEELMRYRVWTGSESSNKRRAIRRVWRIYREVEKLPLPYALYCLANYGANAVAKRVGWLP